MVTGREPAQRLQPAREDAARKDVGQSKRIGREQLVFRFRGSSANGPPVTVSLLWT
jgi:hypothetical protein